MSRRRSSSFATAKLGTQDPCSEEPPLDQETLQAAQDVWEVVFYSMKDARTGQSVLHSSNNVCLIKAILDRSHQLDHFSKAFVATNTNTSTTFASSSQWLSAMLRQGDGESGYTPLHWAVYKSKLPILLLLLRYIVDTQPNEKQHHHNASNTSSGSISTTAAAEQEYRSVMSKRCNHRPLALLQGNVPTLNEEAKAILYTKDNEGLTAFQLMEQLQIRELKKCRQSLAFYPFSDPSGAAAAEPAGRRGRQNSFDIMLQQDHAEQNELADLHDYMRQEQERRGMALFEHRPSESLDESSSRVSYACEVLAFGRSNHLALGVQGGAATSSSINSSNGAAGGASSSSRPQRVQEFAQDRVGRDGSAVAVAAAAHHTLVATRNGHLYAFGVGTGGRLGTGENERHCPAPTRVLGALEKRRVVAVSAAENHSLCVTSEGAVYAFGSNRFGQLGYSTTAATSNSSDGSSSRCCLPRRVDDLWKKNILCVNVAAGEKHSVALSRKGEVYVWGCNASGQLGVSHRRSSSNSGIPHKVQRVDALWNSERRKVCIQIAASSQSTLVLAKPNTAGLPVNQVYAWGHGNHVPSKVHFSTEHRQGESPNEETPFSSSASRRSINPVAIACARFHNAAITADGRVYTWGFHAEPLGASSSQLGSSQKSSKNSGLSVCSCPQLVTGMLPEKGGGIAIAVAASENHTAVVTSEGSLFTWGASYGKDVLGHEGVRWQPSPKRVPGVSRAVGLAAAKEHTILLVGATFPPIVNNYNENSVSKVPSLELIAAKEAAKHVDLFNAIPVLMMAQRTCCGYLEEYCREFIRFNFDGVLNLAQKNVMDVYLNEELATGLLLLDDDARDRRQKPFIMDTILAGRGDEPRQTLHLQQSEAILSDPEQWIRSCKEGLDSNERVQEIMERFKSLQLSPASALDDRTPGRPRFSSSVGSRAEVYSRIGKSQPSNDSAVVGRERSSSSTERCLMLTTNMDLSTEELAQTKHELLSKEIRGLKKRLNQIAKLEGLTASESAENRDILSPEQKEKIARRPYLESELSVFEPALEQVKKAIDDFTCKCLGDEEKGDLLAKAEDATQEVATKEEISFRCTDCKITCPDEKSYALHLNGRKHRNRKAQLEEEEKKKAAELMMKQRHLQQMEAMTNASSPEKPTPSQTSAWGQRKTQSSGHSRYNLPPPPNPTNEIVQKPIVELPSPGTKSLREIMEEEQKKSHSKSTGAKKTSITSRGVLQLPPGAAPPIKSPPWAAKTQVTQKSPFSPEHQMPSLAAQSPAWQAVSPRSPSFLQHAGSSPTLKSPPWAMKDSKTTPVGSAQQPSSPFLDAQPSPKGTPSFGDFLLQNAPQPPLQQQRPRVSSAPWANAAPVSKPRPIGKVPPALKAGEKSDAPASPAVRFQEIQKQEEEFKSVHDQSFADNGKWFIQRRERAGSLTSIQESAVQEREHQLLVEEQKRIEEQIQRDIAIQKKKQDQKRRQKAKKARNKLKNAQQSQAKGGMQQKDGDHNETLEHEEGDNGVPSGKPSNRNKRGNPRRRPNKKSQEKGQTDA